MDSRIVLSTLSPTVATFMSLLEDPYRESTPADVFNSLKSQFLQPVLPQVSTHRLLRASDLQQLQRAILIARSQRRRLKAVTNASCTRAQAALASGAYVLDVSGLCRHSQSRNVLTAQCGTPLSHIFAAYEMATQAPLGRVRSVGGAVATGVLGGCATDSLLADSCVQISVIDSLGRLRVYSASQGGPMFNAIRLSLGAFGVIYDASFSVDKLRRYVKVRTSFHLQRSLFARGAAALQRRLRDAVGVEVVWWPFNSYKPRKRWRAEEDVVWLRVLKQAHRPKSEQLDVCYAVPTMAQWLFRHAKPLAKAGYSGFHARHTPAFQRAAFADTAWKLDGLRLTTSVHHAVHQVQTEAAGMSEVSVCVPLRRDADWHALTRAWHDAVAAAEHAATRGHFPLNGALRLRFVTRSAALLAPNGGAKCSAVLSASSAAGTAGWAAFGATVAARWMRVGGARWVLSREARALLSADVVRRSLGDDLRLFRALYQSSGADDYGMFGDDVLADVLHVARRDDGGGGGGGGGGARRLAAAPTEATAAAKEAARSARSCHLLHEMRVEAAAAAAAAAQEPVAAKRDGAQRLLRRRSSRRLERKAATARREWRYVLTYVALYALLWVLLFGRDAAVAVAAQYTRERPRL